MKQRNMLNREFHHIEDILDNASFRKWALGKGNVRSLFWENWAKRHPERSRMLDRAVEILKAMEEDTVDWDPVNQSKVWAAIQQKMDQEMIRDPQGQRMISATSSEMNPSQFSGLKVLAILAMVMIGALVWLHLEEIYADKVNTAATVSWVVKSAKEGEKKRVRLPDGTEVILNAASEIRYKADFGQANRDIWLAGESYFEVAKDTILPFKVHSGNLVTEALGTAFTVKAYSDEPEINVKLLEGQVKVEQANVVTAPQDKFYLAPGEAAFLTEEGFNKGAFRTSKALLWTEGTLLFDDRPFDDVVRILERWYGVNIHVKGKVPQELKVSGEFRQDNLSNVLKSIAYSFGFEYSIKQKNVSIQFKKQTDI